MASKLGSAKSIPLWLGIVLILLAAFVAAWSVASGEGFGTSPGTMVQLATSHVPTEEDVYFLHKVYPRLVRRDIADLTGSDPGPLRPWVFPRAAGGGAIDLLPW